MLVLERGAAEVDEPDAMVLRYPVVHLTLVLLYTYPRDHMVDETQYIHDASQG